VVRLVFGSIGLAIAATELDRGTIRYGAVLTRNVTEYRDAAFQRFRTLNDAMASSGSDGFTAYSQALDLISGEITRQAMMIAFNRLFFMVSLLFVASLSLITLLKAPVESEGTGLSPMSTQSTE
jgi:DHA2 family multidrug resistance protein